MCSVYALRTLCSGSAHYLMETEDTRRLDCSGFTYFYPKDEMSQEQSWNLITKPCGLGRLYTCSTLGSLVMSPQPHSIFAALQ